MLARCFLLFSLALLSAPQPSQAQPERGAPPTFGIGVTVNTAAINPSRLETEAAPLGFTVPITFGTVRLEPQFGYVRQRQSSEARTETASALTFGTGAFYRVPFGTTIFLAGGRIGITREVRTLTPTDAPSERAATVNLFVGPSVGGEHYVSDHFSIGAEARFYYVNLGQREDAPPERSASILRTGGAAFLRFHF